MHPPAFLALTQAFIAEGADALFTLMGDGNMHWVTAMAATGAVRVVHTRHEHCAVAAAIGYAEATGRVGVASVTCGPGFTQISTALASAAVTGFPIVVFAGEAPMHARWHNQAIDQSPIAAAVGAAYLRVVSADLLLDSVRRAFFMARTGRGPVVLGIPYDLQKAPLAFSAAYRPSAELVPPANPSYPDPAVVGRVADMIGRAQKAVVVAGRGAVRAGAGPAIRRLAGQMDALLATTLLAKGLFDDDAFSLGIAGGFGSNLSVEIFAEADLVIAIGASLSHHTRDGGKLFPRASVVQIDTRPAGLKHGAPAADVYLVADALRAVTALGESLEAGAPRTGFRTEALARRIATEPADATPYPLQPNTLDPRDAIRELDAAIPPDWHVVSGGGHSAYFTTLMRGRSPERFHTIREFGAIGSGLAYAIGLAVAKPDEPVVLIEGDGGLLMHVQEFETIRRHGLKLLICVLNDGAFGAEVHKLREEEIDPNCAIFGREDFAAVARGFRLRGATARAPGDLASFVEDFAAEETTAVWDIHVSDNVMSPQIRRRYRAH